MNPLNFYEAYSAVYNEKLREELLTVEEDFEFIDELSDNELDQVMEEIISEGVELSECLEVFDEVITEAKVTSSDDREGSKRSKVTTGQGSVMAAKARVSARKAQRRAERVERIKSSAKRAAEKVKTTAAGVASAAAGGAAEAGRAAKGAASAAKKKVTGKLAAAKERIKSAVKSGRSAVAGGLRKAAAKIEPKEAKKEAPKAERTAKPYRGEGAGRKEAVGKEVKTAAKRAISTTYRGKGVGRKEAASSGGVSSRGGSMGSEGSKGKALPPVGKTKSGKTLTTSQRATQTAAQNRRLAARLGEDFDILAEVILEDLISEGYAKTFEEAFEVLESMTDYAVGEIAESYFLTEKTEVVDLYDVVLEHLLDEGYADTEEAATIIMANMSEEWRDEILEEYKDFPTAKVVNKAGKLMGSSAGKSDPASKKKENRGIKMMDVTMQHTPDR